MTDRPPTHDVSFELGGIKASLDTITRTLSENRTADAQYRTGIRDEMSAQRDAINAVANDLGLTKRDVSDMKPKVYSLDERATMSRGAQNLAIILGKFGHAVSAGIGGIIGVLIERWLRGGPH